MTTFLLVTATLVALFSSFLTFELTSYLVRDSVQRTAGEVVPEASRVDSVVREYLPFILLVSVTPPLAGVLFVVYVFRRKAGRAVKRLSRRALELAHSSNFDIGELEREDLGFEELNRIRDSFTNLMRRLKDASSSRDMAELELELTRALIIPSDTVKDWETAVENILSRISEVVDLRCFFVGFLAAEDTAELHLFWLCKRDDNLERLIEENVREGCSRIKNVRIETHELSEREVKDGGIKLARTFLHNASVGGVFCAGLVMSGEVDDETARVVDGFLPALMSVVGSAKAIDRYTRDIEYYATRDPLTGLYNQRLFWELLEYEIERAQRRDYSFAVFIIDIDNFKVINDTYGHEFGDHFLKEFARFLRETFRREDIIARYGGDEFAVILPYTSQEEALRTANRLLEELDRFVITAPDGKPIKATVSVGISVYPSHGEDAKELFLVADNIMYRAKNEGKGRAMLPSEEDIRKTAEKEGRVGILILEAIDKELVVPAFQPIVDTKTRETHAYEVLMRIREDGKLMSASEFVHVAERMGIIHKLDHMLIDSALAKVGEAGFEGRLFFNLSPKALVLENFIREVGNILRKHDFEPDRVVFEITERDTVRNIDVLKDFAQELKEEGFHFAVDDFGSGFASFMYLKHLPVDYVKIEGEFIRSILTSRMDRAFVISIIALAQTLEIKTVAEFVESREVFEAIKTIGVAYAQGYYVGKPSVEPKFE